MEKNIDSLMAMVANVKLNLWGIIGLGGLAVLGLSRGITFVHRQSG